MSTVCGLDLSLTSAGIAILVDGKPKLITHVGHTGRDGDNWQHRSRRVRSQVRAVMAVLWRNCTRPQLAPDGLFAPGALPVGHINLAVIEGPLMHGPSQAYEFDRAALWHGVYGALEARKVPIAVVNPNTLKLWWTGDGSAPKLRMLDTARARFREAVSSHDEADSLALACAGAFKLGDPIPWTPAQRSIECLDRVDWPVLA